MLLKAEVNSGIPLPNHNGNRLRKTSPASQERAYERAKQGLTRRLFLLLFVCIGTAAAASPGNFTGHPNRGPAEVDVLLCRFTDSPTPTAPSDARAVISGWSGWSSHFQNMFFADNSGRMPGTGSLKNYFGDISQGAMNMTGSVHGWYTEARTTAVGLNRGIYTNQDCVDAAKVKGYTPPAGAIVVVVLTPFSGISLGGRYETSTITNPLGYKGWTLVPADISFATMAHELGHALDLSHSFSRGPTLGDKEYGDGWDLMSNPQGPSWPAGLNGANLDRMGWLRQDQILTVGADSGAGGVFLLKPLYSSTPGYKVLRIPAESGNQNHYYTIEFRTRTGWDGGIAVNSSTGGIVLIHETSGGSSYLLLSAAVTKQTCSYICNAKFNPPCQNICTTTTTPSAPVQSVRFNGAFLFGVSAIQNGEAQISVSLPSALITAAKSVWGQNACLPTYAWRRADLMDYVCVAPWVVGNTINENAMAQFTRSPSGGAYGPDTCASGYVWREAYPGDHVCVDLWSRSQAADDNKHAQERVANP